MTHPAISYIQKLFKPSDTICLGILHPTGGMSNSFDTVENILKSIDSTLAMLNGKNQHSSIYFGMNPLKTGSKNKTKENVGEIRNVYVEIDDDGLVRRNAVLEDVKAGKLPQATYVTESSPNKFYFIWRVVGFDATGCVSLNRALATKYGGDMASTDEVRFLRPPGFRNVKYPNKPLVSIIHESESISTRENFDVADLPEAARKGPSPCSGAYDEVFDILGWDPLEEALGFELTEGADQNCPFHEHNEPGNFGIMRSEPRLLHCLGQGHGTKNIGKHTWDLVSAYRTYYDLENQPQAAENLMDDARKKNPSLPTWRDILKKYENAAVPVLQDETGIPPEGKPAEITEQPIEKEQPPDWPTDTPAEVKDPLDLRESDIPAFPSQVVRGFYKEVEDVICRNNTLPKQYVYTFTKTLIAARFSKTIKFDCGNPLPMYYTLAIGLTGAGKGEVFRRLRQALLDENSEQFLGILDSVDSGAGLKDAFLSDKSFGHHNLLLYFDELLDLTAKIRPDRQPDIIAAILTLAEGTKIARTKATGRDRTKAHESIPDAHLSFLACVQPGYLEECFVGLKAGVLGLLVRFYPEYAKKPTDIRGALPFLAPEDIARLRAAFEGLLKEIPKGQMTTSIEAHQTFQTWWDLKPQEYRNSHPRGINHIYKDAFFQAIGDRRPEVSSQDMLDAIALQERIDIIRDVFFKGDARDAIALFNRKLKNITMQMHLKLKSGMSEIRVALGKRDFQRKTNAYRDGLFHLFNPAWAGWEKDYLREVMVPRKHGKKPVKKYLPTDEVDWDEVDKDD